MITIKKIITERLLSKLPLNTVNWLLFIMYQFSSVPAMTKLRTDEYKYTFTIDYLKPIL